MLTDSGKSLKIVECKSRIFRTYFLALESDGINFVCCTCKVLENKPNDCSVFDIFLAFMYISLSTVSIHRLYENLMFL